VSGAGSVGRGRYRRRVGEVLSRRAVNRATLERQLLLRRAGMSTMDALGHLVGMQAQAPNAPYVGLWSRLAEFRPEHLSAAIESRRAVRTHLMRATVHLVTARDCLALNRLMRPVHLRAYQGSPFRRLVSTVDVAELVALGTSLLAEGPLTRAELSARLSTRWPDVDPAALAYTVSYQVPTVQVPPRGVWGASGPATWTTIGSWLGREPDPDPSPGALVLRYLAAFGPASVADVRAWSGLAGMREVVSTLDLRTYGSEAGAVLFDLPDAPRPDPDTPAPARFLPEYDNLLLSYADRSRVIPDGRRPPLFPGNGAGYGTILVDGDHGGHWRLDRAEASAALVIEPFARLSTADTEELVEEGRRLLGFIAGPESGGEVRFDHHFLG
jgi:Winged helix DNA-binding domain